MDADQSQFEVTLIVPLAPAAPIVIAGGARVQRYVARRCCLSNSQNLVSIVTSPARKRAAEFALTWKLALLLPCDVGKGA